LRTLSFFLLLSIFLSFALGQRTVLTFEGDLDVALNIGTMFQFKPNNTSPDVAVYFNTTVTSATPKNASHTMYNVSHWHQVRVQQTPGVFVGIASPTLNYNGLVTPFEPFTALDSFGPCSTPFLQDMNGRSIDFVLYCGTVFATTDPVTVHIITTVEVDTTDTPNNTTFHVPAKIVQYYSYFSEEEYRLELSLMAGNGKTPINQRFRSITVGCGNVINLSGVNASEWMHEVDGLEGSVYVSLQAISVPVQADFLFHLEAFEEEEENLKAWQIALIVIGGVVLIAVALAIVAAIIFFVVRAVRGTPYERIED